MRWSNVSTWPMIRRSRTRSGVKLPPKETPLRLAGNAEPSIYEEAQLAIALAAPARTVANKDKSEFELIQQAWKFVQVAQDRRQAANDKLVLLATVGKSRDTESLYNPADQPKRTGIGPQPITDLMWRKCFIYYPGDKHELFASLLCTEVPLKPFLKELFPGMRGSKKLPQTWPQELLRELIRKGGDTWSRPVYELAFFCAQKLPLNERNSLFAAINKCDLNKAEPWLKAYDPNGTCRFFLERLLQTIKDFKTNAWQFKDVPALFCRELIRIRQMQISDARIAASKRPRKYKQRRGSPKPVK